MTCHVRRGDACVARVDPPRMFVAGSPGCRTFRVDGEGGRCTCRHRPYTRLALRPSQLRLVFLRQNAVASAVVERETFRPHVLWKTGERILAILTVVP